MPIPSPILIILPRVSSHPHHMPNPILRMPIPNFGGSPYLGLCPAPCRIPSWTMYEYNVHPLYHTQLQVHPIPATFLYLQIFFFHFSWPQNNFLAIQELFGGNGKILTTMFLTTKLWVIKVAPSSKWFLFSDRNPFPPSPRKPLQGGDSSATYVTCFSLFHKRM